MTYAIVRVRGRANVNLDIKDTLAMLRLNRVNHCVIIPETKTYKGMLQKVKDYVTWGEVKQEVLSTLISCCGKLVGGGKITDEYIKSNTQHSSINAFAKTIFDNKEQYSNLKDVKPVIRLHPPIKGYEGIKRAYSVGGALGYRGDAINQLLQRMVLEE